MNKQPTTRQKKSPSQRKGIFLIIFLNRLLLYNHIDVGVIAAAGNLVYFY